MPARIEFNDEAVEDLEKRVGAGNLHLFLKKLISLEEQGRDAGRPLGRDLTGANKIVVGDRNWRIVFTIDRSETTATVWVVGDRDDAACFELALRRMKKLARTNQEARSLAAVMFQLAERQRATKRPKL